MNGSALATPFGPAPSGPMTFSEILDRTLHLVRRNLLLLLGIAAVPCGAFLAIYAVLMGALALSGAFARPAAATDPALVFKFVIPAVLLICIPALAVFALYLAAACYAAAQADAGIKVTIRGAYSLAWRRARRHIGLLFLIYLRAFLPAIAIILPMLALPGLPILHAANPAVFFLMPLGMLLYFAAYVYGIIVVLRLSLAFPACVVEDIGARKAMERSSLLTKGAKGRIFLILLVIHLICYVFLIAFYLVAMILFAVGVFLAAALHSHLAAPWTYLGAALSGICIVIVLFLWIALTWAGLTTSLALLYNDQRVRKEGYDIERMMHRAGLVAPPPVEPEV